MSCENIKRLYLYYNKYYFYVIEQLLNEKQISIRYEIMNRVHVIEN